jgi:hypothetical protein
MTGFLSNWLALSRVAMLGAAGLSLTACRDNDQASIATTAIPGRAPADTLAAREASLVEQPLGKTGLYLSLPPGFAIKTTDAADFLVYYFAPADTTVQADFSGGLYLGNQPQGDEPDSSAGCRTRRATVALLGHPATFSIRRCATGYVLNSVFDSRSGRTWNGQANAFGEAKSAAGLRRLLAIFATLRRQPAR